MQLLMFFTFGCLIISCFGEPSGETLQCINEALIPSKSQCYYPPEITASQTIRELRDKWVVFMGESTLRQLFVQFLGIIKSETFDRTPDQKGELKIEERLAGSRYTFYYLEYYNNLTDTLSDGPPTLYDGRLPDLIILNDGLHDLLYDNINIDKSWNKLANVLIEFDKKYSIPLMWIPSPHIHDNHLTKHRLESSVFNNESVHKLYKKQKDLIYTLHDGYFYNIFRNISYNKWNFDGIHNMERARKESEGLVRCFYYLDSDPNAWQHDALTANQIMVFLCYSIIFLIVVIGELFKFIYYKRRPMKITLSDPNDDDVENDTQTLLNPLPNTADSGDISDKNHNASSSKIIKMNKDNKGDLHKDSLEYELILPPILDMIEPIISSYITNILYFRAAFQFGICLILLYLCDGPTHYFISPSLKHYNRDFFIFLHIILLFISYLTFRVNISRDSDKILSRLQTEEWKGIMQIIFVMYHYYDASEVYNLIRVFIGAYVWMTGFGNTVFFLKREIFNTTRLFGMLFRLNWLVFWVCLLLNQPLMLYYICPLHTFFFLLCYTVWGIAYKFNKIKYIIELKLLLCGLFLVLLFETPEYIFNSVWSVPPVNQLLSLHGTLYEWHFRTSLDHYATYLGMIAAVYYDNIYKFLTSRRQFTKIAISFLCLILLIIWYNSVYLHDKYTYNSMHPYTESIPIFCYIILRNIADPLRPYYSAFLAWMGQITLETYIFQYHLYMINDAKSILTLPMLQDYPLCNFILVSLFYLWISRIAFNSTNILRNAFYPVKKDSKITNMDVIKQTAIYCGVLLICYGIAYFIEIMIHSDN